MFAALFIIAAFASPAASPAASAVAGIPEIMDAHSPLFSLFQNLDKEIAAADKALGKEPNLDNAAIHFGQMVPWADTIKTMSVLVQDPKKEQAFKDAAARLMDAIGQGGAAAKAGNLEKAKAGLAAVKKIRAELAKIKN